MHGTAKGVFLFIILLSHSIVFAQDVRSPRDLKKLTLEELSNLEVISASRKAEPLSRVSSAIDILTAERIARSGATTIADALRLATGIHVARFDGRTWAISARGFNINTANKMQVLMDGRNLYTPLFSGVFWDVQDTLLEDLHRIEVVRGPGATLWGSNAVNGVINILTKRADETQGSLLIGGGGNEERGFFGARYGGKYRDKGFYRGYFKFFSRDDLVFVNDQEAEDDWLMGQGGFRYDTPANERDSFTVQGDLYRGNLGLANRDDTVLAGGNVVARWTRTFSPTSDLQVQTYYDRTEREVPLQFEEVRNTYDVELQHRFQPETQHDLVWGFNYRVSSDETGAAGARALLFDPADRTLHLISAFVQDEIAVVPNRLGLVFGSKFEYNSFGGFELQPTARIAWYPNSSNTLWGAVSRAVRTPTRIDEDFVFIPADLEIPVIRGNPDFESEKLIALEGGFRSQIKTHLSIDVAAFFNSYDDLRSQEAQPPNSIPIVLGNKLNGESYGAEIHLTANPFDWWRVVSGITFFSKDLELDPDSRDLTGGVSEGNDPGYFGVIQSSMDLPSELELDLILRYVDDLPEPVVEGYAVLDFRLAWNVSNQIELSFVGQNLFEEDHSEFGSQTAQAKQVQHGFYGKVIWKF